MNIEELDLSVRAYNCLKRAHIDTVEQLQQLDDEQLMRVRNIGIRCFEEIRQKVKYRKPYVPPKADVLPIVGEEVLVIVKTVNGLAIHEGYLREDGRWYVYKYAFWKGEVVGWMPKPRIDVFQVTSLFMG